MIPDAWETTGYSTPHCHQKSLDTGSQPIHFAAREEALGTGTLTVTDHGTVTACREVYDLAKKKKLTPILGIEAYFRDDYCPALAAAGLERGYFDPENHKDFDPRNPDAADKLARWPDGNYAADFKYGHVTMHALNQTSYEAMGEILSDADARAERHGAERKPLFDWATMERLGGLDLTMGSGCLIGMVARHLVDRNDAATAVAYYERLRGLVKPGNFYVEIFPHDCSRNFVDAVFIDFADGSRERFKPAKTLRVSGEVLHADQLARRKEWGVLEAHSHRRKWFDLPPKKIVKVEAITGFIENECRPWARNSDVQAGVNEFMLALAEKYGDPALISDDSHYATRDEKIVQEVRLSQGGGTLRFYSSYHRQTNAESYEHFRRTLGMLPVEYEKLLDNNRAWADRFRGFEFKYAPSLPAKFYPQDILTHIISKVEEHGRLPDDPRYYERFAQEINLLHHNGTMDWLPYFACAEDVCRGRFTGPGRGSAAGLLLAYLLEITHVDPLKWNLSLDRFMTPDRIKSGKPPDIDLDFPDRKELDDLKTGWLWQRFGDHVAQISSDTTLKVPSAAKDVARLKRGIADENLEALTKKFSKPPQNVDDRKHVFGYTADDGTVVPGSITTDLALQEYIARWPDDWKIVQQCLGLARNKTRHPCGFVIANKPIKSFLPTMTISGVTCTQYTAASVEACGGIKMDFLGVNSLADIEACITMLRTRSGREIPAEGIRIDGRRVPLHHVVPHVVPHDGALLNVWDLPDDEAVFREMLAGRTETVFQFNTVGAVRLLKNFDFNLPDGRPSLHDVAGFAAFTALDRPGPLDVKIKDPEIPNTTHNMLVEYARRLRGLPESEDVPAFLKEIFLETFGIMVFQEQLQYVYQYLTGCSGADAEAFRSAVAKKIPDKVQAAFPVFMKGATEKLGAAKARQFWDAIESWAAYGFNRSVLGDTILESCENGPKRIKDFYPGEHIRGVGDHGEPLEVEVVAVHDHGDLPGWEVEFEDGFTIVTSINHKFLTNEGQRPLHEIVRRGLEVLADANQAKNWVGDSLRSFIEDQRGEVRSYRTLRQMPDAQESAGRLRAVDPASREGGSSENMCDVPRSHERQAKGPSAKTEWTAGRAASLWCVNHEVGRDPAQARLSDVCGEQTGQYHGQEPSSKPVSNTTRRSLESGVDHFSASRHPTPEGGTDACMAACTSRRVSSDSSQSPSSGQTIKGRDVAASEFYPDMDRGAHQVRRDAEASRLRVREDLGGGGRVLSFLRATEQKECVAPSTREHSTTGRNAQSGGTQARCDIDPAFWGVLPLLGWPHETRMASVAPSDAPLASTGSLVRRRIVRVRSVGVGRMYDLEVAHPRHNFTLPNGVVTSNSHAVCYALIGYVCAWLKHHHPLEWWCAVMQNGKKNEVVGAFWAYCGHLIDLPDLTRTAPNFEIQNDRIVAPISLLQGIGPKAHEQLLAGAPYADLADLCRRVEKHKKDTGHTEIVRKKFKEGPRGKKVVVERDVEQFYSGHSSVHRGVIYALLISGAADALLPEAMRGGPLLDKLDHYERVFAEVRGEKREKVAEWYGKVGAIGLYLLRKSVLPAYTEDLRPVLADAGVIERADQGYVWDDMAVVDGQRFNYLNELEFFPDGGIHVGILAYVQEARPFVYHGSKKATELTLDVNGTSVSMVAWPGRGGRPPEGVTGDLKGCLVLVACRRKDERDFGLQYVKVIERTPREEKKDVKKGEGKSEVAGGDPGTNPEVAGDRGAEPGGLPGPDEAGMGGASASGEG